MTAASATLILSGMGCLGVSGGLMLALAARKGNSDAFLTRTEGRAVAVALVLIITLVGGAGLLLRGFLG
jgi:hypothetical protein